MANSAVGLAPGKVAAGVVMLPVMLCVPTLMPALVSEKFTASEALARTQLYSLEPWVKLMSAPS